MSSGSLKLANPSRLRYLLISLGATEACPPLSFNHQSGLEIFQANNQHLRRAKTQANQQWVPERLRANLQSIQNQPQAETLHYNLGQENKISKYKYGVLRD